MDLPPNESQENIPSNKTPLEICLDRAAKEQTPESLRALVSVLRLERLKALEEERKEKPKRGAPKAAKPKTATKEELNTFLDDL